MTVDVDLHLVSRLGQKWALGRQAMREDGKKKNNQKEDFRFSSKNEREYEKAERKMKWKRRRQNR